MIGRGFRREKATETKPDSKGFDAFELRLGDLMRGERATLGKSLLDVQRELKIKAAYIAAIENCDPSAFDTPGFIAGYVRSYARYLNMDPDWAFETFCAESGFQTAHGMSAAASGGKLVREERLAQGGLGRDIFAASATPFIPAGESVLARVEPRAVGSVLVLVALIAGLGYGGWSILQEVQRVQFAPVDQAPMVVAEIDPLAGGGRPMGAGVTDLAEAGLGMTVPVPDVLDRLYRPPALDVPVMVARDTPIASIDPGAVGALAPVGNAPLPMGTGTLDLPGEAVAGVEDAVEQAAPGTIRVTEASAELVLVAVRPAWVRVRSAEGTTLLEKIMDAGETWEVPVTEDPATLRVGESGAIYFAVNGVPYGPAGPRGQVTGNLALAPADLVQAFAVADLDRDADLAEFVRVAQLRLPEGPGEAASE